MGSWELVPSTGELVWSDNLFRIYGVRPGEMTPSVEWILARTHPDDRDVIAAALRALEERGEMWSFDYRFVRPDGDRRHLRSTLAVVEERKGRLYRMMGTLQDLTDRRRTEREIAAHIATGEALMQWEDLQAGGQRLLAMLADATDCVAGVLWVAHGEVLVPRVLWSDSTVALPSFEAATSSLRLRSRVGLPGRVWATAQPLTWTASDPTSSDPRERGWIEDGLRGTLAIPARLGDEVLAVIELGADREIVLTESLGRSLSAIGYELGQFFGRRRAELFESPLTPRELEVLKLSAQGLSAREAAVELMVSPATVKTHLQNIYAKLEVGDKPSAVATALRRGLFE